MWKRIYSNYSRHERKWLTYGPTGFNADPREMSSREEVWVQTDTLVIGRLQSQINIRWKESKK